MLHRLDELPKLPPREEIVRGLFGPGEIVAVIGSAGVGKTSAAQLMATCLAEGRPFLSRDVLQGPVIYIAAERFAETARRFLVLKRKRSPPIYVVSARPDLTDYDGIAALAQQILKVCERERSCPVLIVIDTLARCMPGLDENSARDMGRVVEGLSRLAEEVPTAAVMFLHHTGKGGSGDMRGSSALIGAVDLELRVENAKDDLKRVTVSKANAVAEGQTLFYRLEPVEVRDHANAEPESIITAVEAEAPDDNGPAIPNGDQLRNRERGILKLIRTMARGGNVGRQDALEAARKASLVVGRTAASSAVQFRRSLDRLAEKRLVSFDDENIKLLGAEAGTPNTPNAPP